MMGQRYMEGYMTPSMADMRHIEQDPEFQRMFLALMNQEGAGHTGSMLNGGPSNQGMSMWDMEAARANRDASQLLQSDRHFESMNSQEGSTIQMEVQKLRLPFSFIVKPNKLAAMTTEKARKELTIPVRDLLVENKLISPNDDNRGQLSPIFCQSWTLGQIRLQELSNRTYMPMCVRVSVRRYTGEDSTGKPQYPEVLPQMSLTSSGGGPCTVVLHPQVTYNPTTYHLRRTADNRFAYSFLQDRCKGKPISKVCVVMGHVLMDGDKPGYKLLEDDPVVVMIKDMALEVAQSHVTQNGAIKPGSEQERRKMEEDIEAYTEAKWQEVMEYNSRERIYYVLAKEAEERKKWIIDTANEVMTARDLAGSKNHPETGCFISIWPNIKVSSSTNDLSASVFEPLNTDYARTVSISQDDRDIEDVGKNVYVVSGTLVMDLLKAVS